MRNIGSPWFRRRRYPHFDRPISLAEARALTGDSERMARHAFYPFLSYTKSVRRFRKDAPTGRRVIEEKTREIAYASHVDSTVLGFVGHELQRGYEFQLRELGLSEVVTAYRRFPGGKSNIEFAMEIFTDVLRRARCSTCCLDIKAFFPSIRHSVLKKAWREVLGLGTLPRPHYMAFRAMTRWHHVPVDLALQAIGRGKHALRRWPNGEPLVSSALEFRTMIAPLIRPGWTKGNEGEPAGIPQGAPISGLLANIAMLEVDFHVHQLAMSRHVTYRRYSDDIVFVGPSDDAVREVADKLRELMAHRGMTFEASKASWHEFQPQSDGSLGCEPVAMQYLGFMFDGNNVLLRSQTIARSIRRMKSGVGRALDATRGESARRETPARVWQRDLFDRYTWRDSPVRSAQRSTFSGYARRAALRMGSDAIRRQLQGQQRRLECEIASGLDEGRHQPGWRKGRRRRSGGR